MLLTISTVDKRGYACTQATHLSFPSKFCSKASGPDQPYVVPK